jgi:hypothetical protein
MNLRGMSELRSFAVLLVSTSAYRIEGAFRYEGDELPGIGEFIAMQDVRRTATNRVGPERQLRLSLSHPRHRSDDAFARVFDRSAGAIAERIGACACAQRSSRLADTAATWRSLGARSRDPRCGIQGPVEAAAIGRSVAPVVRPAVIIVRNRRHRPGRDPSAQSASQRNAAFSTSATPFSAYRWTSLRASSSQTVGSSRASASAI